MKKHAVCFAAIIIFLVFNLQAIESSGHISLTEGDVKIVKTDGEMIRAGVNYPLATGDVILTDNKSRCELQLTNGTIIRMDNNSDIKLVSLLAESVTSSRKITTLKLMSGTIYSMPQVYRKEILQVVTPQVTVKMENRSTNIIRMTEKESSVEVLRGKVSVMYGESKKTTLKSGQHMVFPRKGEKYAGKTREPDEFLSWNKTVNQNFKNLHYGASKVPEQIYIHSPGIVRFAERFSTKLGTWEYNEYFGYVWKPALDIWQGQRPFFDANYAEIDGERVLVPNQAWGWAPVHLGTWFFSSRDGWVWIPGKTDPENLKEKMGVDSIYNCQFWSPRIDYYYMNIDTIGLLTGVSFWQPAMESICFESPNQYIKEYPVISEYGTGKHAGTIRNSEIKTSDRSIANLNYESIKRDWNPDSKLTARAGIQFEYDTQGNQIRFPDLNLTSKTMNSRQRIGLKRAVSGSRFTSRAWKSGIGNFTGAVSTPSNTSPTASSGSAGRSGGGFSGSSGGRGNSGGKKN